MHVCYQVQSLAADGSVYALWPQTMGLPSTHVYLYMIPFSTLDRHHAGSQWARWQSQARCESIDGGVHGIGEQMRRRCPAETSYLMLVPLRKRKVML